MGCQYSTHTLDSKFTAMGQDMKEEQEQQLSYMTETEG